MPSASANCESALWEEVEPRGARADSAPGAWEAERRPPWKRVNRQQRRRRSVEVEPRVEADHRARALGERVGRLDRSGFPAPLAAVEGVAGRPAGDPHRLVSWWVYAYPEGVGRTPRR